MEWYSYATATMKLSVCSAIVVSMVSGRKCNYWYVDPKINLCVAWSSCLQMPHIALNCHIN